MEHLTIVAAYFNQPEIWREWERVLLTYPDELKAKVSLRLVDDHSQDAPLSIRQDILNEFDVEAFVVEDDITWNEMGARNLAMQHSEGWCYMTDPDYVLYPEDAAKLFGPIKMASGTRRWEGTLQRGHFYHLNSMNHMDGRRLHRPENIGVAHTADFWKTGGYDEAFAGGYGFSDALLWRAMREVAGCQDVFVDAKMHHYPKGVLETPEGVRITDAASPALRDTKQNQPIFKRVNSTIAAKGWKRYLRERPPPIRFKWRQFA